MASMPYWGTFDFLIFLFFRQKIRIVGVLNESRIFKKFVWALTSQDKQPEVFIWELIIQKFQNGPIDFKIVQNTNYIHPLIIFVSRNNYNMIYSHQAPFKNIEILKIFAYWVNPAKTIFFKVFFE